MGDIYQVLHIVVAVVAVVAAAVEVPTNIIILFAGQSDRGTGHDR